MQKITKQIFCMILSVCMLILMIPGTSYATEVVMPDEVNTENNKNPEIIENTEITENIEVDLPVIPGDTEEVKAAVPGDTEGDSGNLSEEWTMDKLLADEKRILQKAHMNIMTACLRCLSAWQCQHLGAMRPEQRKTR